MPTPSNLTTLSTTYRDTLAGRLTTIDDLDQHLKKLADLQNLLNSSESSSTVTTITPTVQVINNSGGSNPLTGSIPTGKWFISYETKQGSSTFHGQTYGEGFFDSENFKFLGQNYVYGAINYSVPVGSILVVRYYPA